MPPGDRLHTRTRTRVCVLYLEMISVIREIVRYAICVFAIIFERARFLRVLNHPNARALTNTHTHTRSHVTLHPTTFACRPGYASVAEAFGGFR